VALNPEDDEATGRLGRFLARNVPGATAQISIERIGGGQSNPTFFVDAGQRRLVLRMQPDGDLLPSAHAVDREYRVLSALAATDVPVPDAVCYSDDRSVVGTPFYLMERVEGRVFEGAEIAGVPAGERTAMYRAAAETLARLHRLDWQALGLADFGRPGNYFQRQVARWSRQWRDSKTREIPAIDRLIEWLPSHIPADDTAAIAHGDFRIGNLLFHPTEAGIVAVLDWELSTIGHPMADLAFLCIPYHTAPAEYRGTLGLDRAALGIPEQAQLVDWYAAVTGMPARLEPFHLAFSLFRFAVIFVGIEARAARGNAAGANAASIGWLSDAFAERGCAIAGIGRLH
jgi:aminoglycoside phosphotransferase (APT) family kinase protein